MKSNEIVQRISYYRSKFNISARELSLMIGKNEGYINKLESNDFNLTINTLLNILDALGVTAEEFFADDYSLFNENKYILQLLNELPPNKKANIIEFLKK